MKSRIRWMACSVAVLLLGVAQSAGAAPDTDKVPDLGKPSGPQGDNFASIAKLPDWSGLWEPVTPPGGRRSAIPPLTPEYQAIVDGRQQAFAKGTGGYDQVSTNCIPPGMPYTMMEPYPIEFLFTPGKVTVAIEAFSQMRRIFTDGRKHTDDPDATFNGESIGHWDGDTLVVDTISFVPFTSMGNVGAGSNYVSIPHSDQMHIVERIKMLSPDRLEDRMMIYDSKALKEPWERVTTYGRHKDWSISEYVCEQNNRNSVDDSGKPKVDLSHP